MATENIERELLECEQQYWQALKNRDVDAAVRLTDFPCIVTGAQGIGKIDERGFISMMKDPPYVIDRIELEEGSLVRLLREDLAVVAYKVHEELTVDGQKVMVDAADSSTWVRRDGQWRCALHAEAIAGDPFGRDRAATSKNEAEDEKAIGQMVERWVAATKKHDLPTRLAMLADDVVFMTPGRKPFGKNEFAELAREMEGVEIDSRAEIEEISVCGDSAWYRTHIDVTTIPPGQPPLHRSGFAMTILRRTPSGWVIARDANLVQ